VKIVLTKIDQSFDRDLKLPNQKRQSGFSLIEVMVAALILSTAILGVAGLQMLGMKGTQQSFMKSQAMGVVQNMTERMRANQAGVIAGNYTLDSAAFDCTATMPSCHTTNCNVAQMALYDKFNLVCGYQVGSSPRTGGVKFVSANDNASLVNGTLNVACVNCATGDVRITVGWDERAFDEEITTPDQIIINTRIGTP